MLRSWTGGIDLDKLAGSNMNDPEDVILISNFGHFWWYLNKDAVSCLFDSFYLSRNSAVS